MHSKKPPETDRLVWAICFFAGGILLALKTSTTFLLGATLSLLVASLLLWIARQRETDYSKNYPTNYPTGYKIVPIPVSTGWVLLLLAATLCGAWRMEIEMKWREKATDATILSQNYEEVKLSGRIVGLSGRVHGTRIVLDKIKSHSVRQAPQKISLRYWGGGELPPLGSRIEVVASLLAPSGALLPQGLDFRRHAQFRGIDAYGAVQKTYRLISSNNNGLWLARLRHTIGKRLHTAMGRDAAIARALLTGDRDAVAKSDLRNIRDAGLAHILAISGLHLGLFAFGLFAAVRRVFAFFPHTCQALPAKKIAAALALAAAFFYMLLAGTTLPTQRAFVMSGLVLVAVLCDRASLSLRVVALAALIVLFCSPESITSAGFHMSFAAAATLVAFYEAFAQSQWRARLKELPLLLNFLALTMLTTMVASFATAPFVLYHFGRLAQYGLLANLLAVPLLGAVVLPAGALALVLMPLGWEQPPLFVMGYGIRWIRRIAEWTASLPEAVLSVEQPPLIFLLSASAGFVLMLFGTKQLFRAGCLLGLFALILWSSAPSPLALLGGESASLWIRSKDGEYWRFGGWQNRFEYGQWTQFTGARLQQRTVARVVEIETAVGLLRCKHESEERYNCRGEIGGGVLEAGIDGVHFVCNKTRNSRREPDCQDIVIDREALEKAHALVLYATTSGGVRVKRARQ